jgi:DNA polymerase-1
VTTTTTLGGAPVEISTGVDAIYWPETGLYGLDVETTYLTDKIQWDPEFRVRTVQIATRTSVMVLDLDVPEQREHAIAMLSDPSHTFCSHTQMDVLSVWVEFGIDIAPRNVDTRMLAIMADPDKDEDRDLKTLATAYGMPGLAAAAEELHAWMRERWVSQGGKRNAAATAVEEAGWNALAAMPAAEWPEVFTRYAGLDAVAARRLADLLVPATQNPPELIKVDQWLHVRANWLQEAGKRVDAEMLEVMLTEARLVTGEAKSKAMDLTDGVNIDGPKIIDWLGEHGVNWDDWTGARSKKTGAPSLAKENIKLLAAMPLDEIAQQVVAEMQIYKSQLDILRKTEDIDRRMVTDASGIARIHPALNPIGASTTARMSASGPNMQNFSKKDPRLRGLFLPEPGHVLMTIDFAQIELRVVAALAREETMIEVIRSGGDLHQLTVDLLAERGVTITRDTGKMSNFLIVYGGGGSALHEQAGIPLETAYEVVRTQKLAYPAITTYSQWLAMEKDAIRTVSHRRLPVTRVKGTGERAGEIRAYANINYMTQSSSRECLVYGWQRLESKIPGLVWFPVHDELVLQVPEGREAEVKEIAEWAMTFNFRGVPIEAEAVVLRDRDGVSRWMTGRLAEQIQKEMVSA